MTDIVKLEQHLLVHHGVRFDWNQYGPCDDSPVGIHNRLHWSNKYHELDDLRLDCLCWCHEPWGGSAHQDMRCVCNGGDGWTV